MSEQKNEKSLWTVTNPELKRLFDVEPPEPVKVGEKIPIGVPEGFYNNKSLIDINKGFKRPDQKFPKELPCWGCDKPLQVCGFPFYICDNNHVYNVKTKEKWFWKGYDDVYHELLNVLQGHVEPTYQKLFFPQSKTKIRTEANKISTQLSQIGKILYDKLKVQEDDKYHWGKDNFRHFAGLRFAINMMNQAILTRVKIKFPSELTENQHQFGDWSKLYEYDATNLLAILGKEHVKEMLLSIEKAKSEMPKQTIQKTLF